MADKVQKMLERQREREEAMKKKEADQRAAQEEQQKKSNQAALAKVAPTVKQAEETKPTELWYTMRTGIYGPIPAPVRGKPILLGGDPKGENVLFCVGNNVIIRSLNNPLECDIYSEHAHPTTVARYSPDRQFIASADSSGLVRIWHTDIIQGVVHKLKNEKRALGGAVLDLEWDPESKRILAVGAGREKFGVLFFADSGAGAGEITGHSKSITTCAFRPSKPYRVVTGGEDFTGNWFEGPPFKFKHSINNFSNFINCVRFSPDGKRFLMVGQDKKGIIGDGDSGNIIGELPADAHKGGIYACAWSPNGEEFMTVSGDRTAKIWNASSISVVTTFNFGTGIEDQALGCLWQGEHIVVMNLLGHLIFLDRANPDKPKKIYKGQNKSIEAMVYDPVNRAFYTGSYDTIICHVNRDTGLVEPFTGCGHTNAIKRIVVQDNKLVSAGQDDSLRITPLGTTKYASSGGIQLDGTPCGVAVGSSGSGIIVTATNKSVILLRNGSIVGSVPVSWNPQEVALSKDDRFVVVGGENSNIYVFKIDGNNLILQDGTLTAHRGPITRMVFSPDGKLLASADRNREIVVWDFASRQIKIKDWVYHTARVDGLSWSPNSLRVASGGLDQTIIVWSIENPTNRIVIKGAHQGGINETVWLSDTELATAGQDSTLRLWTV